MRFNTLKTDSSNWCSLWGGQFPDNRMCWYLERTIFKGSFEVLAAECLNEVDLDPTLNCYTLICNLGKLPIFSEVWFSFP